MATLLTMPGVMANATEAALQNWLKNEGDTVAAGDPIAEIETEKATVEMEAESDGVIGRLLVAAGESVDVGAPVAVLLAAGEAASAVDDLLASLGVGGDAAAVAAPVPVAAAVEATPDGGPSAARIFSSPLARRIARDNGVDVASLKGSGPGGRILRRDVEAALTAVVPAAAPAAPTPASAVSASVPAAAPAVPETTSDYTDVPHSRMRQVIARRLTESKSTVPHFYLSADVRMDALLALRQQINAAAERKITVNDLVVKAVGLALQDVPAANAIWTDDAERRFTSSDISVAVAVDGGLLTPVVRGVEKASISSLSATIADFVARAKAGKIRPEELAGGSFSVSNLGMFGTKEFTAILNPPQSGILAVGAAESRPVVEDGALSVATVMTCTLSADHRVIDGAVAAQWLQAFKARMEAPLSLLV
ncbi:pyruvate dehydrogenase complex dihydrolipoamide acetyltransferase [Arthrobacter sp. SW1]|uniref:dihydrolipoamide acetyltransferase family protein n=1 Tax=Arthrobacter sp. SW1 TaxID=1920889 RepID=UPI000877C526|nr:dihydrolipoamide acetyltransferase family protein [Arthrobacter sp. SW1]OFI38853.1 pyruvate dehydrogenase complex dihydrolipoamide acetyltransferase [Arthrobacter sp. SW1]